MTEWKHHIPVEQYLDDDTTFEALLTATRKISETLIEHRAFLRYIELDEEEIDEFSDIADDFYPVERLPAVVRAPSPDEFDEALNRLYDWADKNRVAIV